MKLTKYGLAAVLLAMSAGVVMAEIKPAFKLWPEGAPGALGAADKDIPTLTPYLPDEGQATGAAMVICPGGGYGMLAGHEGRDYALFLNQHGVPFAHAHPWAQDLVFWLKGRGCAR